MENIYSIGYGNRSLNDLFRILLGYNIEYLIDIRSNPHSKTNIDYDKASLIRFFKSTPLKYKYMGDQLGGLPQKPQYFDHMGKIDYSKLKYDIEYQLGLDRIIANLKNGIRICLMCAEKYPANCHRSKLIGESLYQKNINMIHILPNNTEIVHGELRKQFINPQVDIFGEELKSVKSHNSDYVEDIRVYSKSKLIYSMGVYGQTEDEFFGNLLKYKVEIFCDIRNRRGMRGSKYKFVNSNYLQSKLREMGVKYCHMKSLAPSNEIREIQKNADKNSGILKTKRSELSMQFINSYKNHCLTENNIKNLYLSVDFLNNNTLFFCVEKNPLACHRSILIELLSQIYNVHYYHIVP